MDITSTGSNRGDENDLETRGKCAFFPTQGHRPALSSIMKTDPHVGRERVALYIQQMLGSYITELGHVSIPYTCCSERKHEGKLEGVNGNKWEKEELQVGCYVMRKG